MTCWRPRCRPVVDAPPTRAGADVARRKLPAAPTGTGELVLPPDLTDPRGLTAAEYSEFCRRQRQWYLEHGIDLSDWNAVHAVLLRSWHANGVPERSALHRARMRAEANR